MKFENFLVIRGSVVKNLAALSFAALAACTMSGNSSSVALLCDGSTYKGVLVALGSRQYQGNPVNCVSGDFIFDSPGCAAPNGFGLGYPTGTGELNGIGTRWQDYSTHYGPIVFNQVTEVLLSFTGGFRGFDQTIKQTWKIDIDRVSGRAVVVSKLGNDVLSCREVAPQF